MWQLDHKGGWAPNNWCFWTVMLAKTLESPLYNKDIKPVNPKGNQFWIFIGRTDAEAEAPILGPPYSNNWLIGKDSDAGKDWRQDEMGMTGWDGWMALLSQWTWVWASSRRWWWTRKPGMLQSMGLQRVRHDWWTEQQQNIVPVIFLFLFQSVCKWGYERIQWGRRLLSRSWLPAYLYYIMSG